MSTEGHTMHLTRGPCLLCQQEGAVVCLLCGLGLQVCRPCVEHLLGQFPPQTLYVNPTALPPAPPSAA